MSQYIFAPAGPVDLQSNILKRCIEYIGSTQAGYGSNLSKGKRYLKYKLSCSGTAIKRAMQSSVKVFGHDFETYGINVYYYHKEACVGILKETIDFVMSHSSEAVKVDIFGCIPSPNEYISILYAYRISQLRWVYNQDYKGQRSEAEELCNGFDGLQF